MRNLSIVAFIAIVLVTGACTKKNPDLCCTSQADCDAVGIPIGSGCNDGLVCRGNQCIAEVCSLSAECDAAAAFCNGQSCVETCAEDSECPGFGEDSTKTFCENGDCVACRMTQDDCPADKPVCDSGVCRACIADADCASQVCETAAGSCRDTATVLYAAPTGTSTAACTLVDPCTIAHAISLVTVTRDLIRLADGTYHEDLAFPPNIKVTIVGGTSEVIGSGATDVINVDANSNITFRKGIYSSNTNSAERAFHCAATSAQPSTLTFQDVRGNGVASTSSNCRLNIQRSTFGDISGENGGAMAIDQSTISSLGFLSDVNNLQLDIKNTLFQGGLQFPGSGVVSGTVAFSTFAMRTFANCRGNVLFSNDIFFSTNETNAGYAIQHSGTCTSTFDHNLEYPQDLAIGTNVVIGDPKLKDMPGGDYHLLVNSAAIDAADPAATDAYDFDGTPRPQGSGRDIGAFEYH